MIERIDLVGNVNTIAIDVLINVNVGTEQILQYRLRFL
jgi:hypothetical protein